MSLLRRPFDSVLMELVEESGRNVQKCGLLLRDLLTDYPEHATLAQDLKVCEQEGDRITHDIIHRLAGRGRVRAPFDTGDGYALASALDPSLARARSIRPVNWSDEGLASTSTMDMVFRSIRKMAGAARCIRNNPAEAGFAARATTPGSVGCAARHAASSAAVGGALSAPEKSTSSGNRSDRYGRRTSA